MRGPPPAATRLVDLLDEHPDPGRSGRWYLYLFVLGAALLALNAWPAYASPGDPYTRLAALAVGLMFVSRGAAGLLLRAGRDTLSGWSSVLQVLTLFPIVAFTGLALHDWLGVAGAVGWSAFVVAVFCFDATRRRRSRQASADRVGPEHDG